METFLQYVVSRYLFKGLLISLEVTVVSFFGALLIGFLLALMRESKSSLLRGPASFYVWLMRGTPLLLQLIFLYDILPHAGITIPAVPTAIVGFSLSSAGFSCEIIRGGLHSVDQTQILAAESLGLTKFRVVTLVVVPQAMRAMIPGLGNEAIMLLKNTSLASVIAVNELTLRTQQIASTNFLYFEVFSAAAVMYLVVTSVLSLVQRVLERRFDLTLDAPPPVRERLASRWAAVRSAPSLLRGRLRRRQAPKPVTPRPATAGPGAAVARGLPGGEGEAASSAVLVCREVEKDYGLKRVLDGVTFEVRRGEVVVVLGPSGSGKSTLLRLINHLEDLSGGEILVGGGYVGYEMTESGLRRTRDVAEARAKSRIGMVFQQYNLFAHLSAEENITLALERVYAVPPKEARTRARALLDRVGLADKRDALPHRLSGGQQQRVAIARALAIEPSLLLLDEPTSALDPELTSEVRNTIRQLADDGMTMLLTSHDIPFVKDVADRVLFMQDGRIVDQGVPGEVLVAPRNPLTRRFLQIIES